LDRRVKKNQAAIMKAFIELIADKDFEKITIHEIAERADVNRGTIYSHYADKYDLLDKCLEAQLDQLIESCFIADDDAASPSMAPLLHTLKHMEEHAIFYRNLLSINAVPSFRSHLQARMNKQIIVQIVDNDAGLDELNKEVMAQFLSSAVIGVIEWWFSHPLRCSAEEIAEQLWSLLGQHQMMLLRDRGTDEPQRAEVK